MKKLTMLIILLAVLFPFFEQLHAQTGHEKVEVVTIRSRKILIEKFGQKIANQVPNYFDFREYKLVSIGLATAPTALVEIIEPKYFDASQVTYEKNMATFLILFDPFPCVTGKKKSSIEMRACRVELKKNGPGMVQNRKFFVLPVAAKVKLNYRKVLEKRP